MEQSPPLTASAEERCGRQKYFDEGPRRYSHYVGLHNTATASHPAIVTPAVGAAGEGPQLRFDVKSVSAEFAAEEPVLMEDELYLIVVLPTFRATATIVVGETFPDDAEWQFGWITAVSDWNVETYLHKPPAAGTPLDAIGRWELPYIHIACSSGEAPPWYSSTACSERLRSPGPSRKLVVSMECQRERILPQVPWRILLAGGYRHTHKLSVKVEYYSWLAARNLTTGAMHVVRTVVWRRDVAVNLDRDKPFGQRSKICRPLIDSVDDINKNHPLPEWALGRPYVHEELTLKVRFVDSEGDQQKSTVICGPNNHYLSLPAMSVL